MFAPPERAGIPAEGKRVLPRKNRRSSVQDDHAGVGAGRAPAILGGCSRVRWARWEVVMKVKGARSVPRALPAAARPTDGSAKSAAMGQSCAGRRGMSPAPDKRGIARCEILERSAQVRQTPRVAKPAIHRRHFPAMKLARRRTVGIWPMTRAGPQPWDWDKAANARPPRP